MKKNLFVIRKAIIGFTLSVSLLCAAAPAFAKDAKKSNSTNIKINPSVEYIGTDNQSGSFFHVKLDNDIPVRFLLSILNENGDILYTQEYESAKFSKYVKLQNEGTADNDMKFSFTIKTLPFGENHTFNVSTEVKTVKDVVITKL